MVSEQASSKQVPAEAPPAEAPPTPPAEAPPTPVLLGGRVVGVVDGGVFKRTLKPSHFLHSPPAIAIDVDVLAQLDRLKVDVLQFTNAESEEVHATTLTTFFDKSFPLDRGFGRQRAMRLSEFHVVNVLQVPLPGLEDVYAAFAGVEHV